MCSARPIVGSETFTMVRSTIVMKYETASTENARHRRIPDSDSVVIASFLDLVRWLPVMAPAPVPAAYRDRPTGPARNAAGAPTLPRHAQRGAPAPVPEEHE